MLIDRVAESLGNYLGIWVVPLGFAIIAVIAVIAVKQLMKGLQGMRKYVVASEANGVTLVHYRGADYEIACERFNAARDEQPDCIYMNDAETGETLHYV